MSRSYKFQVEAYPVCSEEEAELIRCVIDENMGSDVEHYLGVTEQETGADCTFWGETTLCGGESDQEANDRISEELFAKCSFLEAVETSWLCTEYQEWDNTFSNHKDDLTNETDELNTLNFVDPE